MSVFFSRPDKRDDPTNLFSTIAYELSLLDQDFAIQLGKKLKETPSLLTPSQPRHFHELLLPTVAASKSFQSPIARPIVIIIDALDEGADQDTFTILANGIPSLPGAFRFVATSRPFQWVEDDLKTFGQLPHIQIKSFDIFGKSGKTNQEDLERYIKQRLPEIAKSRKLRASFFEPNVIDDFVERSQGYSCGRLPFATT